MYEVGVFLFVGVICGAVHYYLHKHHPPSRVGQNPLFVQFQKSFYLAYLPALLGDWLQGPYLYKLYSHYGFLEDQIAILYVFGFASTALMGVVAPIAAAHFGRKKLCVLFTITYSVASLLKLSRFYSVLMFGRFLSGVATALLFHTFESWYLHEHIDTHAFPGEWIPITFSKVGLFNSILAIGAGLIGNISAEWIGLGPVAPFIIAIPCFVASGAIIAYSWQENYSKNMATFVTPCSAAFQEIITEPNIFLLGVIQATFEGVLYVIVFLWTPQLDHHDASLGIIFSSFMVCTMLGNGIHRYLRAQLRITTIDILCYSIVLALIATILCILTSIQTSASNTRHVFLFLTLLIYQIAVGIYFPAMGQIRSCILPRTHVAAAIINWFRIPLYILCCLVLLGWHGRSYRYGNRPIFVMCCGLLIVALVAVVLLILRIRKDRDLQDKLHQQENPNENEDTLTMVDVPTNDISIETKS